MRDTHVCHTVRIDVCTKVVWNASSVYIKRCHRWVVVSNQALCIPSVPSSLISKSLHICTWAASSLSFLSAPMTHIRQHLSKWSKAMLDWPRHRISHSAHSSEHPMPTGAVWKLYMYKIMPYASRLFEMPQWTKRLIQECMKTSVAYPSPPRH